MVGCIIASRLVAIVLVRMLLGLLTVSFVLVIMAPVLSEVLQFLLATTAETLKFLVAQTLHAARLPSQVAPGHLHTARMP